METATSEPVPPETSHGSVEDPCDHDTEKGQEPRSPAPYPRLCPASGAATFVKRGTKLVPAGQASFKNSLMGIVGYLELANAGDFAANVWNDTPVPIYAIVLMAIGGTFALVLSIFAFRDAHLSWLNVKVLREERKALRKEKAERLKEQPPEPTLDLDVWLDVTFREIGTEAINRLGMDIMLGGGAIIIGIGTLLAIDGEDRRVWLASNLLSGYIGNAPLALYGLVNVCWAIYIWGKAHQHRTAVLAALKRGEGGSLVEAAVKRRARHVQLFVVASGMTSIFGGAGSLMTSTLWQGYIILVPVIVSSIAGNIWWRRKVGYDRPQLLGDFSEVNEASLSDEIQYVHHAQRVFKLDWKTALENLVPDPTSLGAVVRFLVANDLFEEFCLLLTTTDDLSAILMPRDRPEVCVDAEKLIIDGKERSACIMQLAKELVRKAGLRKLESRERYLAEATMSYMYLSRSPSR